MNALTGFLLSDWLKLLREVKYSIGRKYLSRTTQVTVLATINSRYFRKEKQLFYDKVDRIKVEKPIFILGHWRNGTTLLHELLAMDEQFAFPNLFEISRPHTFLYREPFIDQQAGGGTSADGQSSSTINPKKRPMDNMTVTYRSPGEDEAALGILSLRSPVLSWMFPKYEDQFDRYLTFKRASEQDRRRWEDAIVLYTKKLSLRYGKPLLMKSPTHTARIGILTHLFPDARFIHIHREPFTVFQSTLKLYNTAVAGAHLQAPPEGSLIPGIIRRYQEMYDAFFEQRNLISSDHFMEIGFEDLENDKLGSLKKIYTHLGIENFEKARPAFDAYLKRTEGYKKNTFQPVIEPLRSQITGAWKRNFEEWGYPLNPTKN